MEAVARRNPATETELREVTELRRWQADELGDAFVRALEPHRNAARPEKKPPRGAKPRRTAEESSSPYKD